MSERLIARAVGAVRVASCGNRADTHNVSHGLNPGREVASGDPVLRQHLLKVALLRPAVGGAVAIANAIRLAARGVEHRVVERMSVGLPVYDRPASDPAPSE